jgi:hypothetical protein
MVEEVKEDEINQKNKTISLAYDFVLYNFYKIFTLCFFFNFNEFYLFI